LTESKLGNFRHGIRTSLTFKNIEMLHSKYNGGVALFLFVGSESVPGLGVLSSVCGPAWSRVLEMNLLSFVPPPKKKKKKQSTMEVK
jgi:hypothetical protein